MTPSPRFDIQDDMQLDYVICALDDIDYELSLYQYRLARAFTNNKEAYKALGYVRDFLMNFPRESLGVVDGSEGNWRR